MSQPPEELQRRIAELEARLKARTAELEAANRDLEAFIYSVSHDLRAPLRHMDGFGRLLVERSAGLDETSRRYLQAILQAGARMGGLIEGLLALSRAGRAGLRLQRVEPGAMVEEVRQQLAGEAPGRSIDWRIAPLAEVEADPDQLRTIWSNLLSNAVKFTSRTEAARIEVGQLDDGSREITFFVRDNGAGFDPRYTHKLFGVFERLHPENEFAGIGVGLALVRRIVERHGGRVRAEGEPGRGACFSFTLKKAPAAQ